MHKTLVRDPLLGLTSTRNKPKISEASESTHLSAVIVPFGRRRSFSLKNSFVSQTTTSGRRWSADTNLALRRDLSCQLIANGFPRFAGFVNLPHETDLAAQGNAR